MIAVSLPQGVTLKNFDDPIVLANFHHARMSDNFQHNIISVTDLATFKGMKPNEKLHIAGHGLPGMFEGAHMYAYTIGKDPNKEYGLNHYIKLAVADAVKNKIKIPDEIIVQSCSSAKFQDHADESLSIKELKKKMSMPSLVRAIAIVLAKYRIETTKVIGYDGPAISIWQLSKKPFVINDNPGGYTTLMADYHYNDFKKVLQGISDMNKKIDYVIKNPELTKFFTEFHRRVTLEKLILANGTVTETAKDAVKHLPPGYQFKA